MGARVPDNPSLRFLMWATLHEEQFKCDCEQDPHDADCLQTYLNSLYDSPLRLVLDQILDLDYQLQSRYHVVADDIPARVYQGHKILLSEKREYEKERNADDKHPYNRQFHY